MAVTTEGGAAAAAKAGLIGRLEALLGRDEVSDDFVRFRIALAKAQAKALESLRELDRKPEGFCPHLDYHIRPPKEFAPVEREVLWIYFADIKSASGMQGGASGELLKIGEAHDRNPLFLTGAVEGGILGGNGEILEELASSAGVPASALEFIAHIAAAPFATYRSSGGRAGAWDGEPARCVLCCGGPSIAKLRREDGKRILYCGLCGQGHEYPRLKCPYCGIEEASGVSVIYTEKENPGWVEWCASCGNYLKSFDERKFPEGEDVIPYVEETATLYLDLLAEAKGLKRGLPHFAAF